MPPFGFSDDDVRQAMKDIFGDDSGSSGHLLPVRARMHRRLDRTGRMDPTTTSLAPTAAATRRALAPA